MPCVPILWQEASTGLGNCSELFHEACRHTSYVGKQSICCRMRGPFCPHPGMDPGSTYCLAQECSSVSDVSPHDEGSVDTPADGEEGSSVNPLRWSDSTGWGGGSGAVPHIIPVCNLGNHFFGSFLSPQLKRRPLEGRGDAQAGLCSALDESCEQSCSRGGAAPRPPPGPQAARERVLRGGGMCGLREAARGLRGGCSGSPCCSAAGKSASSPAPSPPACPARKREGGRGEEGDSPEQPLPRRGDALSGAARCRPVGGAGDIGNFAAHT